MQVLNKGLARLTLWSHKLIQNWTKIDYVIFSSFSWILIFSLSILVRLIQGRTLDLVFITIFSFAMIPLELIVIAAFQKYSFNTKSITSYSTLQITDFQGDKLLKNDNSLVFFYTEWCPFCRKSFHLLKTLDASQVKVYRVDLSDENNPLWDSLKIKIVPTLIAFKNGTEFWRANGISMFGLRKKDFKQAIISTS